MIFTPIAVVMGMCCKECLSQLVTEVGDGLARELGGYEQTPLYGHWLRHSNAIKFTPHRDNEDDRDNDRVSVVWPRTGKPRLGWRRIRWTTIVYLRRGGVKGVRRNPVPTTCLQMPGCREVPYMFVGHVHAFPSNCVHWTHSGCDGEEPGTVADEKLAIFWGVDGVGGEPLEDPSHTPTSH